MNAADALAVRLRVDVGVLALVLVGRDLDDYIDRLAADDLCPCPLLAQDPGLVSARPALQQVDVAIGSERVQLVVPVSAEDAVGTPAAVQGIPALTARDVIGTLVAGERC